MCVCVHLHMSERSMLDPQQCGASKQQDLTSLFCFPSCCSPQPWLVANFFLLTVFICLSLKAVRLTGWNRWTEFLVITDEHGRADKFSSLRYSASDYCDVTSCFSVCPNCALLFPCFFLVDQTKASVHIGRSEMVEIDKVRLACFFVTCYS